jgi:hypothetical protein
MRHSRWHPRVRCARAGYPRRMWVRGPRAASGTASAPLASGVARARSPEKPSRSSATACPWATRDESTQSKQVAVGEDSLPAPWYRPGHNPETTEEYRARLESIARAIAVEARLRRAGAGMRRAWRRQRWWSGTPNRSSRSRVTMAQATAATVKTMAERAASAGCIRRDTCRRPSGRP